MALRPRVQVNGGHTAAWSGQTPPASPVMTRRLAILFAVAVGFAVGNLYYIQPLLGVISRDLHCTKGAAGLLVMFSQVGYALGNLLILPLGDLRDRRRLVPLMMLLSGISLGLCAFAPSFLVLAVGVSAVGLTTVSGQLLIPLAVDLADDRQRGRTISVVVSGALTGILVARTISGILAGLIGWRWVFGVFCLACCVLAAVLRYAMPSLTPPRRSSYISALRSVGDLVRKERTLRLAMTYAFILMASFTLLWSSLTFLLSGPPFGYSTTIIGLFGLVGLMGTGAAQIAGRIYDRGHTAALTAAVWPLMIIAWACCYAGRGSLPALLVGIFLLDIGIQAQRILNQSQIMAISTDARSRRNTAYMVANFTGGSIGSVLVAVIWSGGGWTGACLVGVGLSVAGMFVSLCNRTAVQLEAGATPTVVLEGTLMNSLRTRTSRNRTPVQHRFRRSV
jgi:predicted MFS family arabinose efflux permease